MNDIAGFPDSETIHCAAGLILDRGKILLGFRSPLRRTYPNVWDVFGGHVEEGETVEDALVRELQEELDITPTRFDFLMKLPDRISENNGCRQYHLYRITSWSGAGPRMCGAEHTEIRWFERDQALALKLAMAEYRDLFRKHIA